MTTLEAAIEYVKKYNWAVFPVSAEDKTPLTPHGCKDAKKDIGAIRNWWKQHPDAAIGVATGSPSGLIVIDEDIDEDKGINGYHEIVKWENEHEPLPETVQSITGRGGYHLFYHYTGTDIRNTTGLLDGVDVRGEGGYVIVPPSKHPNGNSYEWEVAPDEIQIADLDDQVRALLANARPKPAAGDEVFAVPDVIPYGKRNDVLFKLASSLQAKGLSDVALMASVEAVNNDQCVEPIPADELKRIVASATKYEKGELEGTEDIRLGKRKKLKKLKKASDLVKKDLPELNVLVGVGEDMPLLLEGTCILSARPKLGKSWFALAMSIAIANGDDFLGFKTQKKSVLYLDFESGEVVQKKRLLQILKGRPVPDNLYIESEADSVDKGFIEQIEDYLEQDPNIGLVIVDLFQGVRSATKNFKESEYDHAYRDITPLNEIAQKYHISIMLVCHDRKQVDPEDPFANILGSTGLTGAVTQMIVMFRKRAGDPIHVGIKGKTIDGQRDFNVKIDNAEWSIVEATDEYAKEWDEYYADKTREAVINILEKTGGKWRGKCMEWIAKSVEYDMPIPINYYKLGGWFQKNMQKLMIADAVKVEFIKNGSGGKDYILIKQNVDNVDEKYIQNVDEFEKADKYGADEIPFT